jgi:hypothetical protein
VDHFADLYSKKLGMKKSILQKTLWGEFYLSMKDKKIYKKPRGNLQPMFVHFVLNNIWEVYNSALQGYVSYFSPTYPYSFSYLPTRSFTETKLR